MRGWGRNWQRTVQAEAGAGLPTSQLMAGRGTASHHAPPLLLLLPVPLPLLLLGPGRETAGKDALMTLNSRKSVPAQHAQRALPPRSAIQHLMRSS